MKNKLLLIVFLSLCIFVAIAIPLYLVFGDQYPVAFAETFWLRIVGFPLTLIMAILVFWLLRYLFLKIDSSVSPANDPPVLIKHDLWLALGIYCLLTVIYFYPTLSTLNTHLIGPPEDNIVGYWDIWWANDKVLQGGQSLTFTNFLFFPNGSSLYYVAWSFYNLLLTFPLRLLMGNVAAYNLIILHSFPLAGIGAFLLIKYLTRNSWLALLGGFLFAFSPFHFARAQHHFHINTLQFVPFFVLYYIRAIREGTARNLVLATLFFLLNALSDWNYLFFASYFILFSYIYLAIRRRRWLLLVMS